VRSWWRRESRDAQRRRHARAAELDEPLAPSKFFEPTNRQREATDQVVKLATDLRGSVDEATGWILDGFIDTQRQMLDAELTVEHARYLADAHRIEGAARAELALAEQEWVRDLNRQSDVVMAVEASVGRLTTELNGAGPQADAGASEGHRVRNDDMDASSTEDAATPSGRHSGSSEPPTVPLHADQGDDVTPGGDTERDHEGPAADDGGSAGDGDATRAHPKRSKPTRTYPDPRGPGYADPALLAGRPASSYLHVLALAAVAAADIGAFYQVVAIALSNDAERWQVLLIVVGFTATIFYLAHVSGVILRDKRAGMKITSSWAATLCVGALLVLGGTAFYARLVTPPPRTRSQADISFENPGVSDAAAGELQFVPALVFLALFTATVMVATVGAYLTHNPHREGYASANRHYRDAVDATALSRAVYERSKGKADSEAMRREAADASLQQYQLALQNHAALLRQRVRAIFAQAGGEAAMTDALFSEDGAGSGSAPGGGGATGAAGSGSGSAGRSDQADDEK
jgi:hypothetical protein